MANFKSESGRIFQNSQMYLLSNLISEFNEKAKYLQAINVGKTVYIGSTSLEAIGGYPQLQKGFTRILNLDEKAQVSDEMLMNGVIGWKEGEFKMSPLSEAVVFTGVKEGKNGDGAPVYKNQVVGERDYPILAEDLYRREGLIVLNNQQSILTALFLKSPVVKEEEMSALEDRSIADLFMPLILDFHLSYHARPQMDTRTIMISPIPNIKWVYERQREFVLDALSHLRASFNFSDTENGWSSQAIDYVNQYSLLTAIIRKAVEKSRMEKLEKKEI